MVFIGCFFTTIGLNGLESLMKMIKHILREMEQNKLDSGSGNFSSDSGNEARAGVGSEDGLGSKDEQGSGAGGASSENGLGSGTGASSENGIRSKDGSGNGVGEASAVAQGVG
ncbi:cell wall protein IFF6-like [Quercus suber]|uniref:cell wall protein IFF6-like n=1 Tax=Quercus suber TaxID=58331 RepID=UPI0032DEAF08